VRIGRTIAAIASALGLAFAVGACGSSSKSSLNTGGGAGPGASATSASSTAHGAAFKLGFICSCSGTGAAALSHAGDDIKAWASDVNAAGGINGHPVSVTVLDDGQNAATSLQDAKQLVSQRVMAIVGDASLQDGAWASYIAKQGIPVVGGLPIDAPFFTNPDFFPSGAVLPPVILGQVLQTKASGKDHMGVAYCVESPVCGQLVSLVKAAGAVAGGFQVTGQPISFTAPSYTAPCLKMKSAGVDNLFSAAVAPVVTRIADACAQQGYKPLEVNQATTAASSWLSDGNVNSALLIDSNAPWFDTSIPAIKQFSEALDRYAPGVRTSAQFNADDLSPWVGGKLFQAAAKAGSLTPTSTPADLAAALYKLKNETLGGLSGPLNYSKGKPAFPACYFVASVSSSRFTSPKGAQPICPSTSQVTQLATALQSAA
jgi:branched-chain amino acid transport system substrate-binding protein